MPRGYEPQDEMGWESQKHAAAFPHHNLSLLKWLKKTDKKDIKSMPLPLKIGLQILVDITKMRKNITTS